MNLLSRQEGDIGFREMPNWGSRQEGWAEPAKPNMSHSWPVFVGLYKFSPTYRSQKSPVN